jgi:hypothetical protein
VSWTALSVRAILFSIISFGVLNWHLHAWLGVYPAASCTCCLLCRWLCKHHPLSHTWICRGTSCRLDRPVRLTSMMTVVVAVLLYAMVQNILLILKIFC